jgi:sugar/nucleoside kinase (ribokinase family)
MQYKALTLEEISRKAGSASSKNAIVGFDGFVDKIIHPVNRRHRPGEQFERFSGIADFGQRIVEAAGKSLNIELWPMMEKLGGNGPIMANALLAAGLSTRYVGALGDPAVHPVFEDFARRTHAVSLCEPGITNALEFNDGKIMLGTMASLDSITYATLVEKFGEGALFDAFNKADLVCMVNWTMIPHLTAVFSAILEKLLPNLGPRETGRTFFFDLCDPRKRTDGDLRLALGTISRFRSFGSVTLGLNFAEAQQVHRLLDHGDLQNTPDELQRASQSIRRSLDLTCVVIHPTDGAACATKDDTWFTKGPYCERPKITTGAGDHFNAGFSAAQILGFSPPACLTIGVCTSGQYVRTAQSPSLFETDAFLRAWEV